MAQRADSLEPGDIVADGPAKRFAEVASIEQPFSNLGKVKLHLYGIAKSVIGGPKVYTGTNWQAEIECAAKIKVLFKVSCHAQCCHAHHRDLGAQRYVCQEHWAAQLELITGAA